MQLVKVYSMLICKLTDANCNGIVVWIVNK